MSPTSKPISALLVDDHPVVREGCRSLLEKTSDIRVVAEAEDGESACICYAQYKPNVVVLDLGLPGIDGLETLHRIKAQDVGAHILMFSMHDSETMIVRSLKAGATGYLMKNNGFEKMAEAVRIVAQGKTFIDSAYAASIISHQLFGYTEDPLHVLSQREFQLFKMFAEGLSAVDIAAKLSISPKTVGVHHACIMKKLNIHNPTQLVRLAIHCNVILP
ncbi:MAG: response regulator transcription factor [Sulfuricellaceae bacterium]